VKVKGTRNLTFRKGENTKHPLSPVQNIEFRVSSTFAAAKVFANIFSENIISQTI